MWRKLCFRCAACRSVLFAFSFLKILGFRALVYKLLTHLEFTCINGSMIVMLEEGLPETEFKNCSYRKLFCCTGEMSNLFFQTWKGNRVFSE